MASKTLNEIEAQIMILEVSGPRMGALPENDFHNKALDIFSEIKLISGAFIYPDESPELFAQIEVLKRFLARMPKYRGLTADEITQAFYMNSAGYYGDVYRHYNRELNAEFLGDVLNAYLVYKSRFVSSKIGLIQRALNPAPAPLIPVYIGEDWRRMIDQDLELVASGHSSLVFNIGPKYKFLRQEGYIRIRSRRHWWDWYRYAVNNKRREILRIPASTEGEAADRKRMISVLEDVLTKGEIPIADNGRFVGLLRRAVYLEHLKAAVDCGISSDFFNQIQP